MALAYWFVSIVSLMLFLAILALALLTFVNYQFSGKALLHPAVVFSAVWTLALSVLWAAGDMFYPLLPQTLIIFLFGALAFSAGCWLGMLPLTPASDPPPVLRASSNRIITGLLLVVIAGMPFYYRWLSGLVSEGGGTSPFLMLARAGTGQLIGVQNTVFTIFGTLAELSRIVAMFAFWERERHPKRSAVAIMVALFMSGVTGQKSGPLLLAISLICLDWLKHRRVRWKLISIMFLIMVSTAAMVEFYVHLGGGTISDNIGPVFRLLVFYGSGGFVGFDRVVRDPNVVPHFSEIHVTWLRIARKFGAHVDVPEVSGFVSVGPDSLQTNAFTMYWSNLNLGYVGIIAATMVTGFIVTLVYKRALQKRHVWVFLYATLLFAVVFSIFTEYFFSMIYYLFKVCALTWLVYSLPIRWAQFRDFTEKLVGQEVSVPPR